MRVTEAVIGEIIAHAREDLPNECCGMVGGSDGRATTAYRARNAFESPLRFDVHPSDLFRIVEREIPAAGEELMAIYHSHPNSEAYPSQTDINLAEGWPDPIWVICSLADPGAPAVRGFAIRDGAVEEVELAIG
jgi:[CysO sulfur-carrier protein]-S-L-cysteine hydrolase